MKGTFIFDQLNDVVYSKISDSLRLHLHLLCVREGLVDAQESGSGDFVPVLDTNAIVQLFSPLVTSQRVMLDQFNNPYTAIHTQDGTIMTFAKRFGFLFIALGTENEESLAVIQRRLHVFVKLVNLLCGPIFNLLKSSYQGGIERQKLLNSLLDKWEELRQQELSFQIEAVEMLLVNEYLNKHCDAILETVLEKLRNSGPENKVASHAFLLVNTKLLRLYSSRNASELSASDILMMTMLAHTHHPTCRFELPRSPRRTPSPSPSTSPSGYSFSPQSSNLSGNTLEVPQFCFTPVRDESQNDRLNLKRPTGNDKFLHVPLCNESEESSDSDAYYSPCGSPVKSIERGMKKLDINPTCTLEQALEDSFSWCGSFMHDFTHDVLFLQNSALELSPQEVYTLKIMDGVVLVVVSDIGKRILCSASVQVLVILNGIQTRKDPSTAKQQWEDLETTIKRLVEAVKKAVKASEDNDRLYRNVITRWDIVKKNGLAEYFKSTTTRFMSSKLEAAVIALSEIIQEIFQTLCIPDKSANIPLTSEAINNLVDIQAHVRFNLADYGDYLRVKALRNLTISSYIDEFPNLIHFIYVNRTTNQITVPSTDVEKVVKCSAVTVVKEKVTRMIEFTRTQLQCGHFAMSWKDKHFQYSYFLWFEDSKGNPLKPQVLIQGLRNFPPPGILCGDFFKLLSIECFPDQSPDNIQCYELLCMHSAKTSATNLDQIRKLTSKIWQLNSSSLEDTL